MSIKGFSKTVFLVLISLSLPMNAIFDIPLVTVDKLSIQKNELNNWTPDTTMAIYRSDSLTNLVNGAAMEYLDNGCLVTGYQRLNSINNTSVQSFVMDFGKDSNAVNMFKHRLWHDSNMIDGVVSA
jgi:hypothetical protein